MSLMYAFITLAIGYALGREHERYNAWQRSKSEHVFAISRQGGGSPQIDFSDIDLKTIKLDRPAIMSAVLEDDIGRLTVNRRGDIVEKYFRSPHNKWFVETEDGGSRRVAHEEDVELHAIVYQIRLTGNPYTAEYTS